MYSNPLSTLYSCRTVEVQIVEGLSTRLNCECVHMRKCKELDILLHKAWTFFHLQLVMHESDQEI